MESIGIVINKKAKNSAAFSSYLEAFKEAALDYKIYRTSPTRLNEVIKSCIKNHSIILVGGGDGTIRSAAQLCVSRNIPLGILPLGTLNHFSSELALPATPEEWVQALKNKHTITVDVARVNNRIFLNNSSIGFYPKFAQKRDYFAKSYNKWLSYIPGFIEACRKHELFHLKLTGTNISLKLSTSFCMVSNNVYSYEFPLTFQRNNFHEAKLGIYYFKHGRIGLKTLLQYFFYKKNGFEIKVSNSPVEIHVVDHKEVMIALDGETLKIKTPLVFQSLPNALTLIKNPS